MKSYDFCPPKTNTGTRETETDLQVPLQAEPQRKTRDKKEQHPWDGRRDSLPEKQSAKGEVGRKRLTSGLSSVVNDLGGIAQQVDLVIDSTDAALSDISVPGGSPLRTAVGRLQIDLDELVREPRR